MLTWCARKKYPSQFARVHGGSLQWHSNRVDNDGPGQDCNRSKSAAVSVDQRCGYLCGKHVPELSSVSDSQLGRQTASNWAVSICLKVKNPAE